MKLKYIIATFITLMATGCQEPDELVRGEGDNMSTLTVRGRFAADETKEYESVIDEEAGTITVQVPYYISDTLEIQGDLTKMKLSATLPLGAKFNPGISGVKDLVTGFSSTLVYEDGTEKPYEFKAVYVKSSAKNITKFTIANYPRATITIEEDSTGTTGKVIIYKTSSSIENLLTNAELNLEISPWSTASISNGESVDFTNNVEIEITAQDGTKKTYTVVIQTPDIVPSGELGKISALFGFQPTGNNPINFESGKNRSFTVAESEIVLGHLNNNFQRYDRFTSEPLNKTVNSTGMLDGFTHAITSDDNGVLVSTTLAAAKNQWSSNTLLQFYVWKDGLDNAPTLIYSADIMTDPVFASLNPDGGGFDIGRSLAVTGDIVAGTAQIMVVSSAKQTVLRYKATNGEITEDPEFIPFTVSVGSTAKAVPCTNSDNTDFVLSSYNSSRTHYYFGTNNGGERTVVQMSPKGDWWGNDTKGMDYMEFNGVKLIAIQNGSYSGSADAYNRLCIGNMTTPTSDVFSGKQIMDSRLQNFDPNVVDANGNPLAQNATVTGMTSFYVSATLGGAIGTNANKTGDVCFARSEDGNAIQVYMLTTDHGMLGYEITRFDIE